METVLSPVHSLCVKVGLTPSDGRCALLATYRFPQDDAAPCAKASLRFRANEGEAGEVTVSVVSRTMPRAAQVVKFQVRYEDPLFLNQAMRTKVDSFRLLSLSQLYLSL